MRLLLSAVVLATLGFGCRGPAESGDGAGDDGDDVTAPDASSDADEGVGCSPFSPRVTPVEAFVGPSGLQNRMNQLIDGARTTLDVQMYLFTVQALMDRIIAAKNRGVAVRVLLDPDHDGNTSARSRFTAAGVPMRNAPSLYEFSHAKYLIADGATAAIMSMNFNVDAMSSERNYGVIDRDADDLADLKAIFEMDWAGAAGETPRPADLACTRLVVTPNNARVRILQLIGGAATTLDVEAMYVAETGVREAIVAAKQRGVTVRVILSPGADNTDAKSYFTAAGIPVHDARGFFNHAKLLIADGVAFVGSENFSATALSRNREVGVFVTETAAAAVVQTQFDADWSATQ